jgi:guanine deaminase
MNKFMQAAIEEAHTGVRQNDGGPFGAVIVKNLEIIARGHNQVIKTHDPTAHAEIVAIRQATHLLKRFDLSDCEIYTTCEPCPMCFAAIHWAKMKKLYYGCTRKDAAAIGFDDEFIYNIMQGATITQQVTMQQIERVFCLTPMEEWKEKLDKIQY